MSEMPSKRVAQGQATRERLIEVATGLFAERGYEDTSIEDVLTEAGVSRGALYHHFRGKDALFEAVVESIEEGILGGLREVLTDVPDAVTALRVASLGWIDLAANPVIQRIVLIDAPSVLGWQRMREINERYGLGATRMVLNEIAKEGYVPQRMADQFAHMILAALDEIALVIVQSDDPEAAMADGRAAVEELLRRILTR
jgi:AcrR family transcriptional regulator